MCEAIAAAISTEKWVSRIVWNVPRPFFLDHIFKFSSAIAIAIAIAMAMAMAMAMAIPSLCFPYAASMLSALLPSLALTQVETSPK